MALAAPLAGVVLAATVLPLYRLEEASAKTVEAIGPTTQRIAAVHLIRTGALQIGSGAALAAIRFRNARPVPASKFPARAEA